MGSAHEEFDTLDDVVSAQLAKHRVPAIAVGTLIDGDIRTHGWGVTSLHTGYPARGDTLFQIGSITKVFTATLAMRLVERGVLGLDVPVAEYLPDLPLADAAARESITLRHLLTHTGGLEGDRFEDYGNGDDALARFVAASGSWRQDTRPGELWSYCNSGFSLAGRVIEVVTGQPYESAMRELVLAPLGLERTFFFAHEAIVHSVAAGHQQLPGEDAPSVATPWPIPRASNPAGALIAGVGDLLHFARFHLGAGGDDVLSQDARRAMREPQANAWISPVREWGIGWAIERVGGVTTVGHGGGTNGQITHLRVIPERNAALAILTNSNRGGAAIQAIGRWALERWFGIVDEPPARVPLGDDELARYAGRYEQTISNVTVGVADGALRLVATYENPFREDSEPIEQPPVTAYPVGNHEFYDEEGDQRLQFVVADDGRVRFLRFGGRLAPRAAGV